MVLSTTDKIKGGLRRVIFASKVSYMFPICPNACVWLQIAIPLVSKPDIATRSGNSSVKIILTKVGMRKTGGAGTSDDYVTLSDNQQGRFVNFSEDKERKEVS